MRKRRFATALLSAIIFLCGIGTYSEADTSASGAYNPVTISGVSVKYENNKYTVQAEITGEAAKTL